MKKSLTDLLNRALEPLKDAIERRLAPTAQARFRKRLVFLYDPEGLPFDVRGQGGNRWRHAGPDLIAFDGGQKIFYPPENGPTTYAAALAADPDRVGLCKDLDVDAAGRPVKPYAVVAGPWSKPPRNGPSRPELQRVVFTFVNSDKTGCAHILAASRNGGVHEGTVLPFAFAASHTIKIVNNIIENGAVPTRKNPLGVVVAASHGGSLVGRDSLVGHVADKLDFLGVPVVVYGFEGNVGIIRGNPARGEPDGPLIATDGHLVELRK